MEAILEGAAQVFEALGYAGGTTNRIAEAAGVSIGTLYALQGELVRMLEGYLTGAPG